MYSFFNLEINLEIFDSQWIEHYSKKFNNSMYTEITTKNINNLTINAEGIISAQQIKEDWFPEINADIFLSHSHADEKLALALAGWFKSKLSLNVFIDSTVWGYKNDLLRKFDNKFSLMSNGLYDYDACIYTAAHVDTILTLSLQKMINKTECLILLNTNNSIITKPESEYLQKRNSPCTFSSWIYAEIEFANMVKRTTPNRFKLELIKEGRGRAINMNSSRVKVKYPLNLNRALDLNINHLIELENSNAKGETALNELYRIVSQ